MKISLVLVCSSLVPSVASFRRRGYLTTVTSDKSGNPSSVQTDYARGFHSGYDKGFGDGLQERYVSEVSSFAAGYEKGLGVGYEVGHNLATVAYPQRRPDKGCRSAGPSNLQQRSEGKMPTTETQEQQQRRRQQQQESTAVAKVSENGDKLRKVCLTAGLLLLLPLSHLLANAIIAIDIYGGLEYLIALLIHTVIHTGVAIGIFAFLDKI